MGNHNDDIDVTTKMRLSNGDARDDSDLDDEGVTNMYSERAQQCGVGSWRPSFLQRFANIQYFTVTLSMWSLFGSINFSYYSSVIVQIERQFGLSSATTGFIKNVDNIGYLSTVFIFSHFCRFANKPRLFAFATVLSSSAIFLFAVPHFIWGTSSTDFDSLASRNGTEAKTVEFCDGQVSDEREQFCREYGNMKTFNTGAFAIFILSELIQGIGQSPKFALSLTYMDDNAKDKSPMYFSFMFAMRAFSPVIGFVLGAWTTTLYVDLTDPGIDQKDPRWIGAWWLGFVICAIASAVWILPMILFPPVLRGGDGEVIDTYQGESAVEKAKELPKSIGRILRNKLFVVMSIALGFEVYIMGYFTFLPKYLQQYFGLTASHASIMTGVIGALSWALGPIIGGQIMSRTKKITPYLCMKVVVGITALTTVGYAVLMILSCPEDQWAGDIKDIANPNLRLECNGNCSCDANTFQPLCGHGINYFSPCQAGCTGEYVGNGTKYYTGCSCIDGGVATVGMCEKECKTVIPYAVVLFLTKFVSSMDKVPSMTLFMRTVESRDKSMSLALVSAFLQVMSFPAPIVFGMVIDSACVVLQGTCSEKAGKGGACLYYDNEAFRLRLHGFSLAVKCIAVLLYIVGLFLSRNMDYADQNSNVKRGKVEKTKTRVDNDPQVDSYL